MDGSPVKRRALAARDANAMGSPRPAAGLKASNTGGNTTTIPSPRKEGAVAVPRFMAAAAAAPVVPLAGSRKRASSDTIDPSAKKTRVEVEEDNRQSRPKSRSKSRSRSCSPATSSVFDTSAGDASWATAATADEDHLADRPLPPSTRSRVMSREEVRKVCCPPIDTKTKRQSGLTWTFDQSAEALRLRLGLASYKVRTDQVSVPLADLEKKPVSQNRRLQQPAQKSQASQSPLRRTVSNSEKSTEPTHSLPPPRKQSKDSDETETDEEHAAEMARATAAAAMAAASDTQSQAAEADP
jgi:hypothetical protein